MPVSARLKQGELLLAGQINERLPMITEGLVAHYPFDGTTNGKSFKRNIIDPSKEWVLGTAGVKGKFTRNGSTEENQIIMYQNPWGYEELTWAIPENDTASNADGGWNVTNQPIDNTKKYRLTVWVRRENVGNGRTYLGTQASTVCNLGTTTVNTNPYFTSFLIGSVPEVENNWVLMVYYIHPHDYTGGTDSTSGIYKLDGTKRQLGNDFKWSPTTTVGGHRAYMYYSTTINERQYFLRPRMEICDGTEPTIQDLLEGKDDILRPTTITNLSLHDNGIAVEDDTENCILTVTDKSGSAPWGRDTSDVTLSYSQDVPSLFGSHVLKWSKATKSGAGNIYINGGSRFSSTTSTSWTFSVYVRRADGQPVTSVGVVYLYSASGNERISNVKIEPYRDGWYRVWGSKNTVNPEKPNLVGLSNLDGTTDWYLDGWQVEPKTFPTSYTEKTRGSGQINVPFNLKPPYSINIWHKGRRPIADVINQQESPMIFQLGHYFVNASISFWNYNKRLSVYIKGDTSSAWTSVGYYSDFNSLWDNQEHMYTLVAVNNRKFRIYMDGKYLGEQTSTEDVTNIPFLSMGNIYRPNACYQNLSLYNKELTAKEIESLYGKLFDINSDGNIITKDLKENPVYPSDALHIPLDFNTKNRGNFVGASSESNLIFEDGSVWVGSSEVGELEFNLNRDYNLNWNSDWSIVYWKKPVGTNNGKTGLTGYNLDSLGCNGNSVGGGYVWWGKMSGSNTISSSTPTSITPATYFNNWRMVSLVKSGESLTIKEWAGDGTIYVRTLSITTTRANFYVTQYGYDLKLGGYDNGSPMNTYFKNLIIAKRAFTDAEVSAMYNTQMSAYGTHLQVQNGIKENRIF